MNYVYTHTHGEGKVGVMIEFECSDELSYRTDEFKEFALNTALQIIAYEPLVVSPNDIAEVVPLNRQSQHHGNEFSQALLEQPYVKDHSFSYGDVLEKTEKELRVMLNIKRFMRYGPTAA